MQSGVQLKKIFRLAVEMCGPRSVSPAFFIGLRSVIQRLPAALGRGVLVCCLVWATLSSAVVAEDNTPPRAAPRSADQQSIADDGRTLPNKRLSTIIVDNYTPYTFMNEQGHPDGFSVDLIRAVAQVMEFAIDIQAGTWDQARESLESGRIDLLPMMAYSEERGRVFDFSEPHTISHDAVFVAKGRAPIKSVKDLMGKTVVVMKNDAAHDYLISKGITTPDMLLLMDSLPEALRLLALGKGDAALMPKLVGLLHVKMLGLSNLEPTPVVVDEYNRPFSFAVRKGDKELLDRLSEGLSIVKATGELDQIHKKWFGLVETEPVTLQAALQYIPAVIAPLALIALAFFVWNLSLRKQVALRTDKLQQEIDERRLAEDALLATKQRLELATASGKLGIWDWNIQDNILQWDDRMFELYGVARDSFPGCVEAWQNGVHPDDLAGALEASQAALRGDKEYDTEFRVVHPGDAVKTIKADAVVIRDEDGSPLRMIGLNRDITDRKRVEEALRESEELLRLKLDSLLSPDVDMGDQEVSNILDIPSIQSLMDDFHKLTGMGMALLDLKGTVLVATGWQDLCVRYHRVHPQTARNCMESDLFLGQDVKQGDYLAYKCKNQLWDVVTPLLIGGKHIANIFTGQFFYENEAIDVGFFAAQAAKYGFDLGPYLEALHRVPRFNRDRIKTLMDFLIKFSTLISKLSYGNLKLAKAVSHQKSSEEEVRQLNAELEQRVRERTAQLEAAIKELEAFSYSVSHDLRAPLRHLTGFVNLLNKHAPEALDEKSRHYVTVISDSAIQMGRLIDDILSFSRMGRAEMTKTLVNMERLLKEVLKMFQQDLEGRDIAWGVGRLPEVYGDPAMLRMVLVNLVSNAIKFTNRKPHATIEIGHIPDDAGEEVLYIKDNGAGFDMRYVDRLFGLFQRLHSMGEFEGTGLGLANIQRIIHRHGGRTWAEGAVGQGATFFFSLPKERKG